MNNISSNSTGLFAALTNPTDLAKKKGNLVNDYPVTFRGKRFIDAETAYQETKRNSTWMTKQELVDLLTEVDVQKFLQNPRLLEEIAKRGGVDFLKSCSHHLYRDGFWTGDGLNSPTVAVLVAAYIRVTTGKQARVLIGEPCVINGV